MSVSSRNPKRRKATHAHGPRSSSPSSFSPFEPPPPLSLTSTKLERFAHPSHPHKLFRNIIRNTLTFCDNLNCKRRIYHNEVTYVCFRCDFDLCAWCYTLPTERSSFHPLHESDDEVNDDVFFVPKRWVARAGVVKVKKQKQKSEENMEEEEEKQEEEKQEEEEEEEEEEDKKNQKRNKKEEEEEEEEEKKEEEEEEEDDDDYKTFVPTEEIKVTHETMPENNHEEETKTIDVTVTENEETQQIENEQGTEDHSSSPILRPVATLTFESNNYDGITISNVNHLISSIQGEINIIHPTRRQ